VLEAIGIIDAPELATPAPAPHQRWRRQSLSLPMAITICPLVRVAATGGWISAVRTTGAATRQRRSWGPQAFRRFGCGAARFYLKGPRCSARFFRPGLVPYSLSSFYPAFLTMRGPQRLRSLRPPRTGKARLNPSSIFAKRPQRGERAKAANLCERFLSAWVLLGCKWAGVLVRRAGADKVPTCLVPSAKISRKVRDP